MDRIKKVGIIIFCLLTILLFAACNKESKSVNEEKSDLEINKIEASSNEAKDKENSNKAVIELSSAVKCGEVYASGDLKYNIVAVRTNEYGDGTKFLISKLEVYNDGNEDINLVVMERFKLVDSNNAECMLDIFAKTEGMLGGKIRPGNKIMGEVAFNISESSGEEFILQIGEFYDNYKEAIEISKSDVDKTFQEAFENSGIESEYTLGSPVESSHFTITAKTAKVTKRLVFDNGAKPVESEAGKEFLVVDFTVKNNKNEAQSFLSGFFIEGFSQNGTVLKARSAFNTMPTTIESGEEVNGIIVWNCEEGEKNFYLSIRPDIYKRQDEYVVAFEAE